MPIHTIDLHFLGRPGSIAAYLVPYSGGAVLVDPGPSSTLPALEAGLAAHGLDLGRVTHVLVTHIHLDHVGAAGTLARRGTRVLVHPDGARHLFDPTRLLASAARLFGDRMEALWGEFLPVPAAQLDEVPDGAEISIGELRFTALHTPGHARHHVAYLLDDTVFSGDVGGVRFPGPFYLRLPFVPPETHFAEWAASLERIRASGARRIAATHFGIYDDAAAHLDLGLRLLEATSAWLEWFMPSRPGLDALEAEFSARMRRLGREMGLSEAQLDVYEADNPSRLCARGLERYWRKVRNVPAAT
jgi:glyoxylase-like metal-dependent hydrolase (beta-lactamase superfamily II)